MVRTTIADVRVIITTEMVDNSITSYITGANLFVTQALGTSGLSESLLAEIERWITAHMIAVSQERMAQTEGAGGASITYLGEYARGLSSTPYGQMAMTLDSTGTLATLEGKRPVNMIAL